MMQKQTKYGLSRSSLHNLSNKELGKSVRRSQQSSRNPTNESGSNPFGYALKDRDINQSNERSSSKNERKSAKKVMKNGAGSNTLKVSNS